MRGSLRAQHDVQHVPHCAFRLRSNMMLPAKQVLSAVLQLAPQRSRKVASAAFWHAWPLEAPHENGKGGHGRGVQRDERARGQRPAEGGGQGAGQRAVRRVPARAGRTAVERRSKRPARRGSTRVKGVGGGRAVAGGLHPGSMPGRVGLVTGVWGACACACRPHGRGAHAEAAERRSKRPARTGWARQGRWRGRLWGYTRTPPRGGEARGL